MRIDTSNLGYKYLAKPARKGMSVQWLGCVETDDGEQGALGLNHLTGHYVMYRIGARPIELDSTAVLQALTNPERFNQPGRRASVDAPVVCTVIMSRQLREVAINIGGGNLSLGLRMAVAAYAANPHPALPATS